MNAIGPFKEKLKNLSQLYTYINAPSLSPFPSSKTVFESSASSCDRQTQEDKFVDIVQQLNFFFQVSEIFRTGQMKSECSKIMFPLVFDSSGGANGGILITK
jgi:hypothetical protein